MKKEAIARHYDGIAEERDRWIRRGRYYHRDLKRLLAFLVPRDRSVVEVGCGTGDLLAAVEPSRGLGIDISPRMIEVARSKHSRLDFAVDDAEDLKTAEKFDYVILSNLIGLLHDVQAAFGQLRKLTTPRSRLIITYYSRLWQPLLKIAVWFRLKMPQGEENWLSPEDVENLLYLNDYEVLRRGSRFLCPVFIPGVSWLCNRILAHLPGIRHLCLTTYVVARQRPPGREEQTVSVVIPTKNEEGNVFGAVERTPEMGLHTEYLFVDGGSTDGTVERIREVRDKYPEKDIKLMTQSGRGKANAVFEAMDRATGEILMILDSDLTVPPEELPKFYEALASGRGELINGVRLVYPMEKRAMRFLNMVANHGFSLLFSWVLGFRIKDTLCGTKALSRSDYETVRANRDYFGDFDPFGDFHLIFGAARLNLRIVDIPVHYRARSYGEIKIRRFRDGLLLVRMVLHGLVKLKFF